MASEQKRVRYEQNWKMWSEPYDGGECMKKNRIIAIDVMRGLSLLGMMLVNLNPDEGLSFRALVHTEWFGISLADVFFPCFMFLTGVSAAVNAQKKIFGENWLKNAVKRGIILILIGMAYNHLPCVWSLLLNSGYGLNEFFRDVTLYFRPFGVLQRIGFAYIFGVLIYHFAKTERKTAVAAFGILAITTVGFFAYDFAEPFSESDNISIFFDQILQGSNHNYLQKVFDPEGLYGNITAIASVLFGMIAGTWLKDRKPMTLVSVGCILSLIGWFTSSFVIVSKPLWTAPYVLILSGCFMIVLSALDSVISSRKNAEKWLKLPAVLGAHSMLTYLVSGNMEAVLNSVKVGDTNLYHFLWEGTIYSEKMVSLTCFFCSLIAAALVCAIVCLSVRIFQKQKA